MVQIITKYDHAARAKVAPGTENKEPSMTNQADMKMADVNVIMKRAEQGMAVAANVREPLYGDFTGVDSYHEMLSRIRAIERAFLAYPADLRNRFENDPQKMIDFLDDSANDEEAVKLGLKDPEVLLTELDLDGVSKVTKADKVFIDKMSDAEKNARRQMLAEAKIQAAKQPAA